MKITPSFFAAVLSVACLWNSAPEAKALDLDADGISDVVETRMGRNLDPLADSDGDGFTDGFEARWSRHPFNPQDNVLPWNGVNRAGVIDVRCETVLGCVYQVQTALSGGTWTNVGSPQQGTGNPFSFELPAGGVGFEWRVGVSDGPDMDLDDLTAREEIILGTDQVTADTDGDGIMDGQEAAWSMNPLDPDENSNGVSDGMDDFDTDGVSNIQEAVAGTPAVAVPGPKKPVVWIDAVGSVALYPQGQGSTLTKTATTNSWNASAAARQDLLGDGVLSFTATAINKNLMAGWEAYVPAIYASGLTISYTRLSHSIYLRSTGVADVYELGASKSISVAYTSGTKFEIRRTAGVVTYWKNGVLFYTSLSPSSTKVRPSVAFNTVGAQLAGVTVAGVGDTDIDNDGMLDASEGVMRFASASDAFTTLASVLPGDDFDADGAGNLRESMEGTDPTSSGFFGRNALWRSLTGLTTDITGPDSGAVLQKTAAGNVWDTAAISRQEWCCDGQLSWCFASGDATIGFSTSQLPPSGVISLDFGIQGRAKKAYVYEGGVLKFTGVSYNTQDVFAVRRVGNSIRYLKNDVIFYWSRTAVAAALRGHALIYSSNGIVNNARARGVNELDIDTDDDGMRDSVENRIITASTTDNIRVLADVVPGDDFDGDGVNNGHEELDGTDPVAASSAFRAVHWIHVTGATEVAQVPGTTLQKTGPTTAWDASGKSREILNSNANGCVRFSFTPALKNLAVGFFSGRVGTGVTPLEYGIYAKSSGTAYVFQAGVQVAEAGRADPSAIFEIERSGNTITYRRNGIDQWTTPNASTASMQVMATISSVGASASSVRVFGFMDPDTDADGLQDAWEQLVIDFDPTDSFTNLASVTPAGDADNDGVSHAREYAEGSDPVNPRDWFEPVQWTLLNNSSEVGAAADGSALRKIGTTNAWDANGYSTQRLTGNGSFQFKANPDNVNLWVHFRNPAALATAASLCSVRIQSNRTASLYVGSALTGSPTAFTLDDLLELRRDGNVVSFWKNKRMVTSATVPTVPAELRVHAQLYSPTAVVSLARTRGFRGATWDFDADGLIDEWELDRLGRIGYSGTDDPDGDGLSNLAEWTGGTAPLDYYNNTVPTITLISTASTTAFPSAFLPQVVTVEVRKSTGEVLVNAPVVFRIQSGGGGVALVSGAPVSDTLTIRTGSNGRAAVWYRTGPVVGLTETLTALASTALTTVSVQVIPAYNAPPRLTVTAPMQSSEVVAAVPLIFQATASDSDGTIDSIQLFLRGTLLGTINGGIFTWTSPPPGTHAVVIRATDDRGKQAFATIIVKALAPSSQDSAVGEVVGGIAMTVFPSSETSVSLPLARPFVYSGLITARSGKRLFLSGSPAWNSNRLADGNHSLAFVSGSLTGSWLPVSASGVDWVEVEQELWLTTVLVGDHLRIGPVWTAESALPLGSPALAAAVPSAATRLSWLPAGSNAGAALRYRSVAGWVSDAGAPLSDDWLLPGDAFTILQPASASATSWQPIGETVSWMSLQPLAPSTDTLVGALNLHPLHLDETLWVDSLQLASAAEGEAPAEWISVLPWQGETVRKVWLEEGLWRDAVGSVNGPVLLPGRALLIHRTGVTAGLRSWPRWPSF